MTKDLNNDVVNMVGSTGVMKTAPLVIPTAGQLQLSLLVSVDPTNLHTFRAGDRALCSVYPALILFVTFSCIYVRAVTF